MSHKSLMRGAVAAASLLLAGVLTPTLAADENESSVVPAPTLKRLGDESIASAAILPSANAFAADSNVELRRRDSFRRRLALRTQSAMESLIGFSALADSLRDLESGNLSTKSFSLRARDSIFNATASLAANEIQSLASADSILKRIEAGYTSPLGQHDGSASLDVFLGLLESSDTLFYAQGGAIWQERNNSWEPAGNVGVGVRSLAGNVLLGANAFFDYLDDENPENFQRYSLGFEARSSHLDFSANLYHRISDIELQTTPNGLFAVYTADGWDAEIAARIPWAEWMEIAARRYEWERELTSSDITGFDYRVSFRILEFFSIHAKYDDPESGSGDWGVDARFHFDLTDGLRFRRTSTAALTDPWSRRYESVRRRYEQRIIRERLGNIIPQVDIAAATGQAGALSFSFSTTPPANANLGMTVSPESLPTHFSPNARICFSGQCRWTIVTPSADASASSDSSAVAAQTSAGEIPCIAANGGCNMMLRYILAGSEVTLSVTDAAGFAVQDALFTLTAPEFPAVEFAAASADAFAEGTAIAVTMQSNILRNADTIVTISLAAGTAATPNTDYQLLDSADDPLTCDSANNCLLTIAADATAESFQITALADEEIDNAEAFSIMLINGDDYDLGNQTAFASAINNVGGIAFIQFAADSLAASLAEGNAADVIVQPSSPLPTPIVVTISLTAGTAATPITDYQLLDSADAALTCDSANNCLLTIAANAASESFQITAIADSSPEFAEAFSLMLIDGDDYDLGSQTSFAAQISSEVTGSEAEITFTADALPAALDEANAADAAVQANVVSNSPTIITVQLISAANTATPITDYQLLDSADDPLTCDSANNCLLTIAADATSESFQITAHADDEIEAAESFSLMLIDGDDYALGSQNAFTGSINNVGGLAFIQFAVASPPTSLVEANSDTLPGGFFDVVIQANVAVTTETIITISVVTGTAATPFADYVVSGGSGGFLNCDGNDNCPVTLAADATETSFRVVALNDVVDESPEAFSIALVDTDDYNLGAQTTFGGIIIEGDGGTGQAAVQFSAESLSSPLAEGSVADAAIQLIYAVTTPTTITISLVTSGNTATPDTDYQLLDSANAALSCDAANNCLLTIAANAIVEQFRITALGDAAAESEESFSLVLIDGSDYLLDVRATLSGNIRNTSPQIGFTASGATAAANAQFTATVRFEAGLPADADSNLVFFVQALTAGDLTGVAPLTCALGSNNLFTCTLPAAELLSGATEIPVTVMFNASSAGRTATFTLRGLQGSSSTDAACPNFYPANLCAIDFEVGTRQLFVQIP